MLTLLHLLSAVALNAEQKARTVLVVQDPFTSYYDAQVVADFVFNMAQWLSWLERRPVTAEVESSSLFWVV